MDNRYMLGSALLIISIFLLLYIHIINPIVYFELPNYIHAHYPSKRPCYMDCT